MKIIAALLVLGSLSARGLDPSLKPQLDPTKKAKYAERQRILVDFDGDGVEDMLLSGSPADFGTMGAPWAVYLKRGEDYKSVGEIWAHPMAIAFEPAQTRFHTALKTHRFSRVWTYLRSSGSADSFGYYCVGKKSVDKMASLEIYSGYGGTSVGNAIYEATFKKSPIPYRIQTSKTNEDGIVYWQEIKI